MDHLDQSQGPLGPHGPLPGTTSTTARDHQDQYDHCQGPLGPLVGTTMTTAIDHMDHLGTLAVVLVVPDSVPSGPWQWSQWSLAVILVVPDSGLSGPSGPC